MTTVPTTTMTLRIILSVRGSLAQGGSYAGSTIASSTAGGTSTHVISSNNGGRPQPPHPSSFGATGSAFGVQSTGGNGVLNINGYAAERKGSLSGGGGAGGVGGGVGKEGHVIGTLCGDKARGEWNEGASDGRSSVLEGKEGEAFGNPPALPSPAHAAGGRGYEGVKVTIDREVDYNGRQ
jgi:hypothetical protein